MLIFIGFGRHLSCVCVCVCVRACVFAVKCDAILPACSGSFRHSLALTSTAEPRGTFTTDLASHFQCSNGRPLLSVSTVPSSFQITSPHSPPPPLPISLNLPLFKKKKEEKTQTQVKSPLSSLAAVCISVFLPRELKLPRRKGKETPHASLKSNSGP